MDVKDFTDLFNKCDYAFLSENESEIIDAYKQIKYEKMKQDKEKSAEQLKVLIDTYFTMDEDFKAVIDNILLAAKLEKTMSEAGDNFIEANSNWDDIYNQIHLFYPEVSVRIPEKFEFLINDWGNFRFEDGKEIPCETWVFSEWFCKKFDFYKGNKYYHLKVQTESIGSDCYGKYYVCRVSLPIWD